MEKFQFILLCVAAYLLGSIPFGFLVARARGIDIRKEGSGNIGGTNITRVLGFKWGLLVAALDFGKGYLASLLAAHYYPVGWQMLVISMIAVLGHVFSGFLAFKGGKGVATTFGILGFYFGIPYFALFLIVWYVAVKYIKLMSLVNLIVGLLLPLAFWLKFHSLPHLLLGVALCVVIWWSHRENIKRLLKGKELPTNY